MIRYQDLRGSGLPFIFVNFSGTVTQSALLVSAHPGILCQVNAATRGISVSIYLQLFDASSIAGAISGASWVIPPFAQYPRTPGAIPGRMHNALRFMPGIRCNNGLVLVASRSSSGYTNATSSEYIGAMFAPDFSSTLGTTVPA
jgi:hypothetical protein